MIPTFSHAYMLTHDITEKELGIWPLTATSLLNTFLSVTFAPSEKKPIISCNHLGNWRHVGRWFMITNLKRALNTVSSVGDSVTLVTALSPRQASPALTGGPSSFSGTLKTPDSNALSSHIHLAKPSCMCAQPLLLPFSYSRQVPLNPPPVTLPIMLRSHAPPTFPGKMPPSVLSPLSCLLCWCLSSGSCPSTFQLEPLPNRKRKHALSVPHPLPLWPHSGPGQITQRTKYWGTLSYM